MTLKPCPCGMTPEHLTIAYNGQGTKWAEAVHCDWAIEFRTLYHPLDSDACKQLAEEAWNDAPRSDAAKELAASAGLSCPNCDNAGFTPEQDGFGQWYQQQCEFCYTVKDSVFNRRKEQEA